MKSVIFINVIRIASLIKFRRYSSFRIGFLYISLNRYVRDDIMKYFATFCFLFLNRMAEFHLFPIKRWTNQIHEHMYLTNSNIECKAKFRNCHISTVCDIECAPIGEHVPQLEELPFFLQLMLVNFSSLLSYGKTNDSSLNLSSHLVAHTCCYYQKYEANAHLIYMQS